MIEEFTKTISEENSPKEVGRASVFGTQGVAILEDFFIEDKYRNKGIGTDFMLDILLSLCSDGYSTLSFRVRENESDYLYRIAKKLKMNIDESEEEYFKFKLSDLSKLVDRKGDREGIISIEKATESEFERLGERILESEECPYDNPVYSDDLEKEISLFHKGIEDIDGAIFFDNIDGVLYLSYLWTDSADAGLLRNILVTAYEGIKEKYGEDVMIEAYATTAKMGDLLRSLGAATGEKMVDIEADLLNYADYLDEEPGPEYIDFFDDEEE